MKSIRDNFPQSVIKTLERRVNGMCSNPDHRVPTSGPTTNPNAANNIGVAAHIEAAAPGGPRYNSKMSKEERTGISNAIWLCTNCATLIDKDQSKYTVEVLCQWKEIAEQFADEQLGIVPISPKEHGALRAHVFGTLTKKQIPNAVDTMCRMSAKYLEEIDPRFSIDVAYQSGQTTYKLNPKSPIHLSAIAAEGHGPEFSDKFNAFFKHGKGFEIDSSAVRLHGSKLFEMHGGKTGKVKVSTNLRKAAIVKISVVNEIGTPQFVLDDVVGEIVGGAESMTFSGKNFGGLITFEYTYVFNNGGTQTVCTHSDVDYSVWEGKDLRTLPYFDKLFKFYETLFNGGKARISTELDGMEVMSGKGADLLDKESIKDLYTHLRYIRNVRSILRLVNKKFLFVESISVSEEDVIRVEQIYHLLFESRNLRGDQIEPIFCELTLSDNNVSNAELEKLMSEEGSPMQFEIQNGESLNFLGIYFPSPKLRLSYSKMQLIPHEPIGQDCVGKNIPVTMRPAHDCQVEVELADDTGTIPTHLSWPVPALIDEHARN